MYKIAVLGDAQSVQGFAALGLQVCPAENAEQARPILHRLAAGLTAELDRYRKAVTPAIILIPGKEGSLGLGMQQVKTTVERAVGADII